MKNRILVSTLLLATCGLVNAAGFSPSFYVGFHSDYNKLAFDEDAIHQAADLKNRHNTFFTAELEKMREKQVLIRRHDQAYNGGGNDGVPFAHQEKGGIYDDEVNNLFEITVDIPNGATYIDNTVTANSLQHSNGSKTLKKKKGSFAPVLGMHLSENFAIELSYSQMVKFKGNQGLDIASAIHSSKQDAYIAPLNEENEEFLEQLQGFLGGDNGAAKEFHEDNNTESIAIKEAADIKVTGFSRHDYEFKVKDIYHLDLIASLPIHDKISLLGTIGVGHYKVKVTETFSGKIKSAGSNGTDPEKPNAWDHDKTDSKTFSSTDTKVMPRFGVGIAFNLTDAISLQAMARYQKMNMKMNFAGKKDVSVFKNNTSFGMGLTYAF